MSGEINMEKSQKTAREIYLELKATQPENALVLVKRQSSSMSICKKHTPELIYLIRLMRLIKSIELC